MWYLESHLQLADRCTPWKFTNGAVNFVLHALQFQIPRLGKHVITDLISALWRVTLMLALNRSLDREYSNKCSEGLGFNHFYMRSPCNPLVEDYTEVFYMIHKGGVPSIHCEMNLRSSKSMKEDGPGFILIEFRVPAFAPRLS
jgi:hypothetical protein